MSFKGTSWGINDWNKSGFCFCNVCFYKHVTICFSGSVSDSFPSVTAVLCMFAANAAYPHNSHCCFSFAGTAISDFVELT